MKPPNVTDRLRALVVKHKTQAAAAAAIGITPVYFGDLLRGRRTPGPKVLAGLGLTKVIQETR